MLCYYDTTNILCALSIITTGVVWAIMRLAQAQWMLLVISDAE